MAIGAAGSIIGAVEGAKNQDEQMKNQQMLMGDQYKYNEMMANNNQNRAKQMWDYTSYGNQVKNMEKAGINPALLYGQSGGGGVTAAGGQGSGVSQPTDQSITQRIRSQEMGLSLANMASQVKLNESQAMKNEAEAEKIAGVDTELTKATTGMQQRITELQTTVDKVLGSQEKLNAANYFKVQAEERKVWEEVRNSIANADVAEGTKEANIQAAGLANWNSMLKGIETIGKTALNEQQVAKLKNDMAVAWANVAIGESSVSNQADKIANDLMLGNRDLDRRDEELLKDWIYEGVNAGKQISGEIINWMSRGGVKTVTTVASKIEEMFNGKGQQIGTKVTEGTTTTTSK